MSSLPLMLTSASGHPTLFSMISVLHSEEQHNNHRHSLRPEAQPPSQLLSQPSTPPYTVGPLLASIAPNLLHHFLFRRSTLLLSLSFASGARTHFLPSGEKMTDSCRVNWGDVLGLFSATYKHEAWGLFSAKLREENQGEGIEASYSTFPGDNSCEELVLAQVGEIHR